MIQGIHSDQPITSPHHLSYTALRIRACPAQMPGPNVCIAWHKPELAELTALGSAPAAAAAGEVDRGSAESLSTLAGLHAGGRHAHAQLAGLAALGSTPAAAATGEVDRGSAGALPALAGLHAGGGHARAQLAGLARQAAAVGAQRQARAAQLLAQRRRLH